MAQRGRRKSTARRGSGALAWFGAGLVLGLGLAGLLYFQGFLPNRPGHPEESAGSGGTGEAGLLDAADEVLAETPESRYDFFTVLPEMEVLVPERELSSQARPGAAPESERFILQAGSFRNAADADQMKARIALLGTVASIQQVTVNNQTWHRVRIGPVEGARHADELRRQLQDNGIEVLVLKDSS